MPVALVEMVALKLELQSELSFARAPRCVNHAEARLSRKSQLDIAAYYYGFSEQRGVPGISPGIELPSRAKVDIRWARRLSEGGEWSVGVHNLLGDRHREFSIEPGSAPTGMHRSVYTGIVWQF